MRISVFIAGLLLGLFCALPLRADLEDTYVKAYFYIQDGEAFERSIEVSVDRRRLVLLPFHYFQKWCDT